MLRPSAHPFPILHLIKREDSETVQRKYHKQHYEPCVCHNHNLCSKQEPRSTQLRHLPLFFEVAPKHNQQFLVQPRLAKALHLSTLPPTQCHFASVQPKLQRHEQLQISLVLRSRFHLRLLYVIDNVDFVNCHVLKDTKCFSVARVAVLLSELVHNVRETVVISKPSERCHTPLNKRQAATLPQHFGCVADLFHWHRLKSLRSRYNSTCSQNELVSLDVFGSVRLKKFTRMDCDTQNDVTCHASFSTPPQDGSSSSIGGELIPAETRCTKIASSHTFVNRTVSAVSRSPECFPANCFQILVLEKIPKVLLLVISHLPIHLWSRILPVSTVHFLPLSSRIVHTPLRNCSVNAELTHKMNDSEQELCV